MKRRLDKGLYTRLDHFQDDLFSIFDRARDISKENSRIFADSIILQKEFIKVRDELCGKGSILSSKALGFNERQLNKVLIMQAKIFKRIGKDEELTEDTSDEITEDEDLKTFVQQQNENADNSNCVSHNQIQYFVGDFVYVIPPEKNCDFPILHIRQLWKNKAGEEMCYGCQYYRPAETSDLPTKEFYEQEVFKTEKHMSLPLSEVIGKCIVLSSVDYSRLRVDNFHEKDVYVCEYHYSTKNKIFKKIEIWPYSLPEGTQITERVKHLVMRRGEFIFKEQIGEHKEKLAELADETKIINHLPNVLKSTVLDIKGNIYYKQYSSGSVTIKLGDFVYTRNRGIIHVIGIWVTSEEEAFISGTRYVHAHDVAIITDRKPYKTEVYLTFKIETLSLSEIIGKCCVLYIKEYITQRHTEIPESDVYLCEKFYNEMSQRLITLKNGILKFTNFPPEIYPNEIYYFWKPLNPKNIESVFHPTPTTPIPISTTKPSKKKPSVGRKFFQQKSRKNQVSGYNLFYAEIWRSLRQRNPDLDFGKLARLVSIEWKKLTETERKSF
ncbi:Protein polybromo-1 [Armadillidium vulgare]|nr:Protein polybromo-1 [Armadillidium vulgare]